jgi:hypothetical protein
MSAERKAGVCLRPSNHPRHKPNGVTHDRAETPIGLRRGPNQQFDDTGEMLVTTSQGRTAGRTAIQTWQLPAGNLISTI